ncbi:MAG TPA: VWA domain-containing protein [Candidatus Acidoferrum sp.]
MHIRIVFAGFLLVWLLAGAASGFAQAPPVAPATAPVQQGPAIRSTTRLIQVSVIVQNHRGEPITGLKPEDFTVFDDKQEQKIAFFIAEAPGPVSAPANPLPPGVFTNRFDLKGQDPGTVTVVLFDELNTAVADQAYVRKQVIRFLQTLKPQDRVAVYALTTQLIVLHDFTQDSAALVKAVSAFSPKEIAAYDASTTAQVDLVGMTGDSDWAKFQAALNNANGMIAEQKTLNRVGTTVGAIEAIANHISGIPGRKSLVWVSGGFPIQIGFGNISLPDNGPATLATASARNTQSGAGQDQSPLPGATNTANQLPRNDRTFASLSPEVYAATRALNQANVAIYPVDAKGVEIDPGYSPGMRGSSTTMNSDFFTRQDIRESSRLLADRTGGEAFFGSNDIRNAMRRAFDDGRYAYTIGFYPQHGNWTGEFRELKVKVKTAGAHLRYRKGYFAFADRSDAEAVVDVGLQDAAVSPLESTSLGVIVSGKPAGELSARNVALRLGVDVKQFLLQESDNRHKGSLDLLFVQRSANGAVVAAEKQHVDLNFDAKEYESLSRTSMVLGKHLVILPQSEELRVLVRDSGSGSVGSVTMPVKTWFSTEGKKAD